jgi:cytochrome c oxidase subunit 3
MVLFIATEAVTFASAIASYFYLRFARGVDWPPPGEKQPDLLLAGIGTGVLVVSCVPTALAVRRARDGHDRAAGAGVLLSALGGCAFLTLQVLDWVGEYPSSRPSKDAYGSLFFSVTGLHAAHVLVGVGMLLFLVASAAAGRLSHGRWEPVRIVALYWYFMAVLALAVYATVYLSPYL